MTLSRMLHFNSNGSFRRVGLRTSLGIAALIAVPACILGVAGFTYYIYKRRNSGPINAIESVPKTPLETAISLKNRGNKFFKAGQYAKALQLYDEGLAACPMDASAERAALYQNRAAAKENMRQFESAVLDCTLALEQSPRYLKALNRRAHLYEKLEEWEKCLSDVVACCVLEEFKNTDNIICMDQMLKKIGQIKAQVEWNTLAHSLPSSAFIQNYLSAFAWNPFEVCQTEPIENGVDESDTPHANGTEEMKRERPSIADQFLSANEALKKALVLLSTGQYEESMKLAFNAVTLFETAFSYPPLTDAAHHMAEGDEVTVNSTESDPIVTNGLEAPSSLAQNVLSEDQREQAKAASQKASLLYATYLALAGRAVEARQRFQAISVEGSGADSIVRVNALIKSACISMSVDQDFAACLYDFQAAQNACPDCPDVYLHRGQINLLADQLDEALHDLNTAVKLKPEFSIAQAQRQYTLYRKAMSDSNAERATSRVKEFRRLAEKYPTCLETHSLFAQVLTERGEFTESDEEFAKVIELSPNSGLAYAHRGLLQLRWRQDRDAAFKWFSLGAKADPKCELIHELLGQLAVERGDFKTALEHFDLAIKESKTQNDLAHLIALREGVRAQSNVCQKYGLSVTDVVNSLKREQQHMMMGLC